MFIKFFSTMLLLISLLGCHRLTWGEKSANPKPPQNKIGSEIRCLDKVLPVMQDFVKGQAQAVEIAGTWDCFSGALELFKNRVRGEHPQGYKASELKEFFEQYFLKEGLEISPRLLSEIMTIKQIFVGGENQVVTRAELQDLIQFSQEMKSLSLQILPSMKILSHRWSVQEAGSLETAELEFDQAKEQAENVLLQLAARIESKGQSYKFESFVTLMKELEVLYGAKWSFLDTLEKGLPLFQKLKKTLTGTDETLVQAAEWRQFGMLGVRTYLLYLRYHYFVQENPLNNKGAPDYRLAFKSIDDLLVTCGDFISRKPSARLEVFELEEVFTRAERVFPSLHVSKDLLPELMKIKTALVGGTIHEFSPADFSMARTKLSALRTVAELSRKWSDIFTGVWKPEAQPRDQAQDAFRAAEMDLSKIAENLGGAFESSFDLQDLLRLVKAFEETFPPKQGAKPILQVVENYFHLGVSLKNLILNDWNQGSKHKLRKSDFSLNPVILKENWIPLLRAGSSIYARCLFYQYFIQPQNWIRGFGLQDTQALASGLQESLHLVIDQRNGQGLSPWEVSLIFQQAQKAKVISLDWEPALVTSLVEKVVNRFLTSPVNRFQGKVEKEISKSALSTLMVEVNSFLNTQKSFDQLLDQKPIWNQEEIQKSVQLPEVLRILEGKASMALTELGRVYLDPKKNKEYDEASFLRLNLSRGVVRWLFRSYAGSLSSAQELGSLTQAETEQIFADFRGIAVELGLLDPSNLRFAKNRFMEANLFTPLSDGDELMSFQEGTWLFSYIFSGLKINGSLTPGYDKVCGKESRIQVDCALNSIFTQMAAEFANLPEMLTYLQDMDPGLRREMLKDLFTAIGWLNSQRTMARTDLALFPHILQYIESLMRRGDLDGNGIIDMNEAMKLEPVFRPLLQKVSGFDDPQWLQALFSYILVYGQAPEGTFDELFFASDWLNRQTWPIQADRKQFAKILGVLTAKARTAQ